MAIYTASGLAHPSTDDRIFNTNGSIITVKKISETDWIIFGDLAQGLSEGFAQQEPDTFCPINLNWEGGFTNAGFPIALAEEIDWNVGGVTRRVLFVYEEGSLEHGEIPYGIAEHFRDLYVVNDNGTGHVGLYMRMYETYPPTYIVPELSNIDSEWSSASGYGPLTYTDLNYWPMEQTVGWDREAGTTWCLQILAQA